MPIISSGQITITDLNDGYTLSITGGNRSFSYAASGTTPAPTTSGTFGFTLFRGGISVTPTTYSWTASGVLSGTSATATFQPTLSNTYSVATPTTVTLTVTHQGNSLTTSVPVLISQAPSNAVIDTIFVSAPAIYKDVADAATTGTYTTTTIQGRRYDGSTTSNFGWITITPNTTGTESARTDTSTTALTLTPTTTSGVSSYIIRLYAAASGGTAITSQTLNVVFKGAAGTTGSSGTSPVLYELGLSAAVIARSPSNVLAPSSLVVNGFSTTAGTKSAYSGRFKIYEDGVLKYTSGADQATYTYTPSVATVGIIKTELYAAGGVTTLLDTQEVPVVVSGSSAMTFSLTNSAYPIPADTAGAVATYVGSGTSIQVLEGSELYTYVTTLGTTTKTFTIGTPTLSVASAITVGALSGTTTTTAVVAQHSAMSNSVEAVVISYPLTYIRANGATGTQTVTQSITKVKSGTLGIRGSRTLYSTAVAYTSTYDFDGVGAITAGAASYAAKATALIDTATSGSNPTTPINGDTVTFSNGSSYVYTITHNGTSWVPPGTVIDGSLLVTGSVTAAKINSNGLSIRDSAGNLILSAGADLSASSLNLPGTVSNVPAGWQNSNIVIGGRNLIKNTLSGTGWTYDNLSNGEFSLTRSATTETGYIYSGYFTLPPNTVVTLSFESKEVGSIGSRDWFILSDTYPTDQNIATSSFPLSTTWVKNTFTYTTPNATTPVRLRIDHNGGTGTAATIYARNIKLELGNKATDWTPAPEDLIATDLSNAPASILNSNITLTSLGAASTSSVNSKLDKASADVLSATISVNAVTGAGFRAGNLTWDSTGAVTPVSGSVAGGNAVYGKGVAMTPGGLIGHNGTKTTFAINSTTGNASFGGSLDSATGTFNGSLQVGTSPAISTNTMTGSGAIINSNGTFALGSSTANVTFNGTQLTLNGEVVTTGNVKNEAISTFKLARGAALPDYVRTYKGGVTPTVPLNTWMALQLDATALNNKLGAGDYDAYRTLLPAGTYFYELSVPVKCQGSDTNDACYTAIISNPPGTPSGSTQTVCGNVSVIIGTGKDAQYGTEYQCWQEYVPTSYTVLSTAGVNVIGDWQTATVFGVGRFTLTTPAYISAAVKTTDAGPALVVVGRAGYSSTILRIWRDLSV